METTIEETHIIYKTVDVTTGEYYIGLHSWRGHREHGVYFGSFGEHWNPDPNNLVRITLAEYSDRETLKDEEVEWIGRHLGKTLCKNTHNRRLVNDNWGKFGEDHPAGGKPSWNKGRLGKKHTEETREKIGNIHRGKTLSEETREKIREARLGKNHTDETREKMSESHSRKGNPMWGKNHSKETREKQREAKLGKKLSSEHREKLRHNNLGKKFSSEHRAKLSEAQTGKPKSQEAKNKQSETMKNKPKVACCYCGRFISSSNIARHEAKCKEKYKSFTII